MNSAARRKAQRRAAQNKTMGSLSTVEQAAFFAEKDRQRTAKLQASNEACKAHLFNRSNLERLAPSKKPRRSASPLPEGLLDLDKVGTPAFKKAARAALAKSCAAKAAAAKSGGVGAAGACAALPTAGVVPVPAAGPVSVKEAAEGTSDPNMLWREYGTSVLLAAGWKRCQSRNYPGQFYFEHRPTGRTVVSPQEDLQPEVRVRIHGLQSSPELNDALGICKQWLAGLGRWNVILTTGNSKAIEPEHLCPIDQILVCLSGLECNPELNGTEGVVERWSSNRCRWNVRVLAGGEAKTLNFKAENIVPLPSRSQAVAPRSGGRSRPPRVVEKTQEGQSGEAPLPRDWEKRESRRKPGTFYYVHLATGEARMERPAPAAPVRLEEMQTGV